MQNQFDRMQQMAGMRHNMLRDMNPAVSAMAEIQDAHESDTMTPFPEMTPLGMAYVPFQQWEEPYDLDMAFHCGTAFSALDFPYRGGGSCA